MCNFFSDNSKNPYFILATFRTCFLSAFSNFNDDKIKLQRLQFSWLKLENGLKKQVRNVDRIKYGFIKLVEILFTFNKRCGYVIPSDLFSQVYKFYLFRSGVYIFFKYVQHNHLRNIFIDGKSISRNVVLWKILVHDVWTYYMMNSDRQWFKIILNL